MKSNFHFNIVTEGSKTYEFDLITQDDDLSSGYEIIPANEADLPKNQQLLAHTQQDGALTIDTLASRLKHLPLVLGVKITNLFTTSVQSFQPPHSPRIPEGTRLHPSRSIDSVQSSVPMTVREKQLSVESGLIPRLKEPGSIIDATHITTRMKELGIPGVGIAVINNGKVEWTQGYGELDIPHLLSQVASTSKTVAALTMLSLIDQAELSLDLDTDVSSILGEELWKSIDPDGLSKGDGNEVTIRHLLSHTAGMTVGGFSGYPKLEALDQEIKELEEQLQSMKAKQPPPAEQKKLASKQALQTLDLAGAVAQEGRMRDRLDYLDLETGRGLRQMKDTQQVQGRLNFLKKLKKTGKITTDDIITGKGNSDAVKITKPPGSEFRYSGGGTTVLQKVIEVVTGRPYDKVAQELVLDKLGMRYSTFSPDERHITGHGNDEHCKNLPGGSRYHPELAAAGLWTTPSDLAQVAIGIQRSLAGKGGCLISPKLAQEMLTSHTEGVPNGLGVFVEKDEEATIFSHGGSNIGYRCMYIGNDSGQGAVVITNSDFGDHLIKEIIPSIAKVYDWSGKTSLAKMFSPAVPSEEMLSMEEPRKIDPKTWVKGFTGEYLFEDHTVKVYEDNGKILAQVDASPPFEMRPLTKNIACYHPSDPGPWDVVKFETAEDGSKNLILFGIEHKRRV